MSRPIPPRPAAIGFERRRVWVEIAIVLGLTLGASAVYSVVSIASSLTRETPLASQTTTLNPTLSDRPVFDLIYQLLGIFFDIVPVALALYLLWLPGRSAFTRIGLDARRVRFDLATGVGLAALIGIPGLGLYAAARALGVSLNVVPAALDSHWWTVPVLVLSALRAALVEEIIVVGYLFTRLRELGWGTWPIIVASALLRGSYHLYQGFGGFVGNVVMGVVFGWFYARYGRTMPLVVAHWILDIVSFVGYSLAAGLWPDLFGPPAD
ncbi:CPBP family intramembrane glutamic endopeptidase [Planctomonas psychrotolerans]|uniref:CPBP family intramembrane glutamic endopeptidase n=1 Tax=Planctomonas psychrotolerans TaxID=2528712 RepID=UPI00123B392B|nr:CPBP family intramembrane glutamic endopeptidase [Planctomonas psychrotolerans]